MKLQKCSTNRVPQSAHSSWVDQVFQEFFDWPYTSQASTYQSYGFPVDLYEKDTAYQVVAELPGIPKDDIKLSFKEGVLNLNVERDSKDEETSSQSASRAIRFPDNVDAGKTEASYKDGVLYVTVPKSQEAQPQVINIA